MVIVWDKSLPKPALINHFNNTSSSLSETLLFLSSFFHSIIHLHISNLIKFFIDAFVRKKCVHWTLKRKWVFHINAHLIDISFKNTIWFFYQMFRVKATTIIFLIKKMINFVISFLLANTNASLQRGRYKISTAYNTGYLLVKSKLKQNKRIKVIIRSRALFYWTEHCNNNNCSPWYVNFENFMVG